MVIVAQTESRFLTISNQPGICIPPFYLTVSLELHCAIDNAHAKPSQSTRYHHGGVLTTVIGIVGALGKIKATSSNLDRRRQF